MKPAQWSVLVRSLDSGERLYERQPHKLMMPGSNMKIVTLAAAAELLGWDARFPTTLETAAPVEAGVLQGDLLVRGGGDPTLGSRDGRGDAVVAEWAAALRVQGIDHVAGRVVGDDTLFDAERLGYGWSWDDLQYDYAAPVGALQWDQATVELTVHPGPSAGSPGVVRLSADPGLAVSNRTLTTLPGVAETIEFRRRMHEPVLEVWGTVPLVAPALPGASGAPRHVSHAVAVVDPARFFAQALKRGLLQHGVGVGGDAISLRTDPSLAAAVVPGGRVLARTDSPPLRDIATVLMKVSQNLYAEMMVKAIGARTSGNGTFASGRDAILAVLDGWGIDTGAIVMADGSGLSRYNYLTAEAIVRILERMYEDPRHREPFLASLPRAGRDGTIAGRMKRSRAEGNAAAKTGSLSNVRALSGYVQAQDGEMLAFSILANGFAIEPATVTWIADLAVEVLATFSRNP